ncbi:MAG: hypothetical protein COV48_04235, partial [Elusimicrobia bacterium CG11_big_fil_rev_8_21_14_0_20_64_6]
DVFIDNHDRSMFIRGLERIERDTGAHILAYCLMGNHFHLAVQVGPVSLSSIMQRMLTAYVLSFNLRHGRTGHLFQARYKAILCLDDAYLAALIRYIHSNPIRAGLVLKPENWPWSSAAGCAVDSDGELVDFDPWPKDTSKKVDSKREANMSRLNMEDIGGVVAAQTGISIEEMRSDVRRRQVVVAKRLLSREAVRIGYSSNAVAKWLNSTPASVARYIARNTVNTGKPDTSPDGGDAGK